MTKLFKLTLAAGAAVLAVGAHAQAFPAAGKTITLIVPFAAGGPTDKVARDLAEALRKPLGGATIVVDNAAGAGSTIGTAKAARAAPDGYTLLVTHVGMATTPTLYRNPGYKYDEFEYLGLINEVPMVVVAKPQMAANTWAELNTWIGQNKGKVNLANAGLGSASHLCGLMLQNALKSDMTTVPYKGTAPAMTDLIGGQVMAFTADFGVTVPQHKGGKIRGLAVTSTKRAAAVPDLPTVNEALGLKDYELTAYFAVFAPAGTPAEAINKMNAAVNAAANSKDIQDKFAPNGFAIDPGTPQQLAERNKIETVKWEKAIREAKIEPQ